MKIAILADPLDNQSAGVHTYTRHLVVALIKYDQVNEYVLIREKEDPELGIQQIAVPQIRLPIGFASLRMFFVIPYLLRQQKVDAVLEPAHFGPFNLPSRIKRITMIHDLTPILLPEFHRFHSQVLQRIFLKRILKKAALILSNSKNTSKDIKTVFPFTEKKVTTILLGRDLDFHPLESKKYLEGHQISLPYFLSVGTIEPRKNLILLLDAFEQFRDQSKCEALLIIVGSKGWKSEAFFECLEKHKYREDIILTGFVEKEELKELYSHALALVYPSLYEGFGLPILEALSCGIRVICSNTSSMPEVGGESALYFDPKKVEELVPHLHSIFHRPEISPDQKKVLLMQAESFSWKKYVSQFQQALIEME